MTQALEVIVVVAILAGYGGLFVAMWKGKL